MAKYQSAFNKSQARRKKRISIMGKKGVAKQDAREARGTLKAAFTRDTKVKSFGREAVKRVGEYKKAKAALAKAAGKKTKKKKSKK